MPSRVLADSDDWFHELLGRVGCHETLTVVAAIFDTSTGRVFTPVELRREIQDRTRGRAEWHPSSQNLHAYCEGPLSKCGVVEPVQVHGKGGVPVRAYRPVPQNSVRRLRLYESLLTWALEHPELSVQQLIGPPRGPGRSLPAELRLPMYRMLVNNPGAATLYRDLIAATVTHRVPAGSLRQSISVLSASRILVKQRLHNAVRPDAVVIAPQWVPAISSLVHCLDDTKHQPGNGSSSTSTFQDVTDLLNAPHTVADLLTKAATFSASVVGHREGASATATEVYQAVADYRGPVTANDICQRFLATGRPIGRFRILMYLRELADAGKLVQLEDEPSPTDRVDPTAVGIHTHYFLTAPPTDAAR